MLLRWLLRWAADGVPLGRVVIRSTRGRAPYPHQLLESLLAGILGLGVLMAVLGHVPAGGAFFAAGLAAHTLGRQGILHLRAEPRKTRLGALVTVSLAALVLVAALVLLAR